MGFLSFPRYSVESVFRNRRRSLFAIIGIVIALSLLSGSWIAVDSSAQDFLRSRLKGIVVDFEGGSYSSSLNVDQDYYDERIEALEDVKDVEQVEGLIRLGCQDFTNGSSAVDTDMYPDRRIYVLPEGTTRLLDIANIDGTMPDAGTAAVPKSVADELELDVGDNITFLFVAFEGYYDYANSTYVNNYTYQNVSIPISRIWTQGSADAAIVEAGWGHSPERPSDVVFSRDSNPVFLNLADLPTIASAVNTSEFQVDSWIPFYIWIDREAVVSLADLGGSVDRLEYIRHRLEAKGSEFDVWISSSNLVYPLMDAAPQLEGMKLLFAVLALPVIALGTYLSIVGVDLGVNERRREVGILKSRGASNRQVLSSLLLEAVVLGSISGLAGLVAGAAVSRGLMGATAPLAAGGESSGSLATFSVSPYTVVFSVIVGILLMVASSYRPFKRVSKVDVAEALHHYSPIVSQIEYKPKWDIISLALVTLSVSSIVFGTGWVFESSGSWILQLVILILFVVGVAVFPLVPFLLSFSVVRLLTRGSRKLYSKFTLIVKPWTKELHHFVDRNIVRNPRRASNLCVIISLALTFGIFISVTVESSIEYEIEQIRSELGSDIRIESTIYFRDSEETDPSVLDTIDAIPGVDSALAYYGVSLEVQGTYTTAALFDSSSFRSQVKPSDFYFVDSDAGALDTLDQNGTVLLTKWLADSCYLLVGDRLDAKVRLEYIDGGVHSHEEWDLTLTVSGLVKALPGFPSPYYGAFVDVGTLSFIPEQTIARGAYTVGYMIDLSKDANATAVAAQASSRFMDAGLGVSYVGVLEDRIKGLEEDPGFAALSEYLYAEYAFSITIMTVGVGLLIFVAVTDREQELACIMARGASGSQMRKILMGESLTLMVIGLIVGLTVGMLTAYMFNVLSSDQVYGVVERRLVVTSMSGVIVLGSVVSLLGASLLATARAGKIKLAEVLRIRGG